MVRKGRGQGWRNESQRHRMSAYGIKTNPNMPTPSRRFGKPVKEVITIDIYGGDYHGSLSDKRAFATYDSVDEAIEVAREIYLELKDEYPELTVSISFDEWEYESGDVLGDATTLSLQDFIGQKEYGELQASGGFGDSETEYRGHIISRLFPSGYYEYYSDKDKRFIKSDEIGIIKSRIDRGD